jgi:hypothetical protein
MLAVCLGARIPYVPKCDRDRPEAERTTFYFQPLSARSVLALSTLERTDTWQAMLECAALGLRGWSNFRHPDGSEVPFVRDESAAPADQPYLDNIDAELLAELYTGICSASRVSRADAGKSTTPSG